MNEPRVSVVIPTVGRESLSAAVASALAQTTPPEEVIVAVDLPTVPPAANFEDPRVRTVATGGDRGGNGARQAGVDAARGDVIAFLDDDDYWYPNKLATQVPLLIAARARGLRPVIGAQLDVVDESGQRLRTLPRHPISEGQSIADYLFKRHEVAWGEALMSSSMLLVDRSLLHSVPLDQSLRMHQDWDWLVRVSREPDVYFATAPGPLLAYRQQARGHSISRGPNWRHSLAWADAHRDVLSRREYGDLLMGVTIPLAVTASDRRGALGVAFRALRAGRPGFAASVAGLTQLVLPHALIDRASGFLSRIAPGPVVGGGGAPATELLEERPRQRRALGAIREQAARRGIHPGGVVANAGSLFSSTVVTSLFGFAFWIVAAHTFSATAVGAGGAAVSAMQLVAMASMLGLGTLLIGELSRKTEHSAPLIMSALLASTATGLIGGLLFAVVVRALSSSHMIPAGLAGLALFAVTAGVSGALLVLDDATVGLSHASWQFWRNLAFSVLKLAALPIVATVLGLDNAAGLLLAWLAGAVLSVFVVVVLARRAHVQLLGPPRRELISSYRGTALTHHWLNLSSGAPKLVLPVLVAAYLTPTVNASFYSALLLVSFAYIASTHLGTALFGIASGDHSALEQELRRTIRICAGVALASLLVFGAGGHLLLSMFGKGYEEAALPLAILAVGTFPNAVRSQYIAVCRVNGDLSRSAVLSCLWSGIEILLPLLALAAGGSLVLVSSAWVLAMILEAIALWPAVAFAARLPGRFPQVTNWIAPRTLARAG
jgi:O-antigen/teichoic acid export membrane protein